MDTISTICNVPNAMWFCLTGIVGVCVVVMWTTNKIIQNVFCKHNGVITETTLLVFKHPNAVTCEVLSKKCAKCKKVINETITKLR